MLVFELCRMTFYMSMISMIKKNVFMRTPFNPSLIYTGTRAALYAVLCSAAVSLTACQSLTGVKTADAVETADNTEAGYYEAAISHINKTNYNQAIENLKSLRIFYPTGQYAEQALLDLMYAQFMKGEHETAVSSAEKFIRLYPNNPQTDYAYYVRGVANMAGPDQGLELISVDQSARDTTYYQVAFANFVEFINKYPNSQYAPDAAQRMTYIYNEIASHELHVAKWYIKRKAYLAAANRAKWVFQYFPRSESVPESAAILTYTYEKLGLINLADQYREVLQLNYPQWLTRSGKVKFIDSKTSLNPLNKLGKPNQAQATNQNSQFINQTESVTQNIGQAAELSLPSKPASAMTISSGKPAVNFGLGLPESEAEAITSGSSVSQAANDGIDQLNRLNDDDYAGYSAAQLNQTSITLPSAEEIEEAEKQQAIESQDANK